MSNVKRIRIGGMIPYDAAEDEQMATYLAQLNAPALGVRIMYGTEATMVPNEKVPKLPFREGTGPVAFFLYEVSGREAVSWDWLKGLKDAITRIGGTVVSENIVDLEG